MIDRLFSAILTFTLLAGGTAAIWSEMVNYDQRAAAVRNAKVVQPAAVAQTDAVGPATKAMR
jgi:hypothetical protein